MNNQLDQKKLVDAALAKIGALTEENLMLNTIIAMMQEEINELKTKEETKEKTE